MKRTFWLDRIAAARARRNVVWLSGVRRVGKTTLVRDIRDARYFDCELPEVVPYPVLGETLDGLSASRQAP